MMNPRGWRLGAIIGVAGLALAGCGGDGGSGDGDGGGGDPDSQGPLAEFFGWDKLEEEGGEREWTEEDRQEHYEVQALIVDCMAEQGFEYVPEEFWGDQEDDLSYQDPHQEIWDLQQDDPEAFAKEYGYGITTIDYEDRGEGDGWDPAINDPNHEYRESLSEAALEEYEKALWGDWSELEEEAGEDGEIEVPEDFEAGGCYDQASREVYGAGAENEDESQFEDLWEEWDALYERTQSDPRLVEVKQAWSSCMASAGYPDLEEIWDAQEQVYDKQSELYGWDEEGAGEVIEDPDPDPEQTAAEGVETEPDPEALAEVREFELTIAWADYECKQEHDVERIELEVQFEHEEQFIEDHREQLEEYRDWLNEQEQLG